MAHALGEEGIDAAVGAGVDSIEHRTMLDEAAALLMAEKGTWLVPTLEIYQRGAEPGAMQGLEAKETEKFQAVVKFQSVAFQRALQTHPKIAFGLDDYPDYLDGEFVALVKAGMKPAEALQAATVNAAELLEVPDQIGALEAGKFTDITAVSGDPLANITNMKNVVFVMKGGEIIKNMK
jgi:imidazolonepropionase-like amidohydrolase